MSKFIVRYHLQDGTRNTIMVTAYNVFHAVKIAKEKLGKVHITSVTSANCEKN